MSQPIERTDVIRFERPFNRKLLRQITASTSRVVVEIPIADEHARAIADAMLACPMVTLVLTNPWLGQRPTNLDVVRHFPRVTRVQIRAYLATKLEPLSALNPDLKQLWLDATKGLFSLSLLARFRNLEALGLDGHRKDIEVIDGLKRLEGLYLRSITLPNLNLVGELPRLWWLWLGLGGTKSLSGVEHAQRLKYLELWMIKGLRDLEPIARCKNLAELYLQSLRQVRALPTLTRLTKLRRITLHTMRGLTTLSTLSEAAALNDVCVVCCPQLKPRAFEPLRRCQHLRRLTAGIGARDGDTVEAAFSLPPSSGRSKLHRPFF